MRHKIISFKNDHLHAVKSELGIRFEVGDRVKHQGAGTEIATIEGFEKVNEVEIRAHTSRGYCNISYLTNY